jgi:hypothetical protein
MGPRPAGGGRGPGVVRLSAWTPAAEGRSSVPQVSRVSLRGVEGRFGQSRIRRRTSPCPTLSPTLRLGADARSPGHPQAHDLVCASQPDDPRAGELRLEDIANIERALRELVKRLGGPDGPVVCYEAGPCGYGPLRLFSGMRVACDVVAPSLVPVRAGDRVKTDRRDAKKLLVLYRGRCRSLCRRRQSRRGAIWCAAAMTWLRPAAPRAIPSGSSRRAAAWSLRAGRAGRLPTAIAVLAAWIAAAFAAGASRTKTRDI